MEIRVRDLVCRILSLPTFIYTETVCTNGRYRQFYTFVKKEKNVIDGGYRSYTGNKAFFDFMEKIGFIKR